jgi:flagellar motility protein MotE (MotC chaperone)
MKLLLRDFRVLPVVIFAAACLLVLKLVGLTVDGRYIFSPFGESEPQAKGDAVSSIETKTAAPAPRRQRAQETLNFPETTGSSAAPKPPDGAADAAGEKAKGDKSIPPPKGPPDGKVVPLDGSRQLSPGERAVLERLQERRQELDARARELEIRENLLKAAEKRLEAKADEIKKSEGGSAAANQRKAEAEAARFKSIVTMYENMKPKDAAKIFDRLDMKVLIEVASQFNPRKMSDVMAQMSAEAAEKLTVELANRANGGNSLSTPELPKIEGRPNGT